MRRILATSAAVALLAVTHAVAQQPIATPILASDGNFRDLAGIAARYGGTGFANPTAHDGVMRTGVFYRSEVLNVSDADLATLTALHLAQDIDLRTPSEIATTPDRVPPGTTYRNVNIYGTPSPPENGVPTSPAEAAAHFAAAYRNFVADPVQRAAFHAGTTTDTSGSDLQLNGGSDAATRATRQSSSGDRTSHAASRSGRSSPRPKRLPSMLRAPAR